MGDKQFKNNVIVWESTENKQEILITADYNLENLNLKFKHHFSATYTDKTVDIRFSIYTSKESQTIVEISYDHHDISTIELNLMIDVLCDSYILGKLDIYNTLPAIQAIKLLNKLILTEHQ